MAGLKHFRHRRHDVIVFHVLDPAELDFSFSRPTIFQGLEQMPTSGGRSAVLAAGLRERNWKRISVAADRLPPDGDRLSANEDRPAVRHGVDQLPGCSRQPGPQLTALTKRNG